MRHAKNAVMDLSVFFAAKPVAVGQRSAAWGD
jgi:hypothetical protein